MEDDKDKLYKEIYAVVEKHGYRNKQGDKRFEIKSRHNDVGTCTITLMIASYDGGLYFWCGTESSPVAEVDRLPVDAMQSIKRLLDTVDDARKVNDAYIECMYGTV